MKEIEKSIKIAKTQNYPEKKLESMAFSVRVKRLGFG